MPAAEVVADVAVTTLETAAPPSPAVDETPVVENVPTTTDAAAATVAPAEPVPVENVADVPAAAAGNP
jgi:hypothetical protein